ncbi:MAG: squalene synthase HpnC [Rubrivivax sp.]
MSVEHYENFPVASVLCPPRYRAAVVAIYHFARTADDIADEGAASTASRQQDLQAFRTDLLRLYGDGPAVSARWPQVFGPLRSAQQRHQLPAEPLLALLDAFMQDTGNPVYANREALLRYCALSANPVGRLLLHLNGVADDTALRQSDAICSALQLINFWQDLSVDLPRERHYVPDSDLAAGGLSRQSWQAGADSPQHRAVVASLCAWARTMMWSGAPLVERLPGRAGWELRLVVLGGLRVLEKIEAMNHTTLRQRPRLRWHDLPVLLWRACTLPRRLKALPA